LPQLLMTRSANALIPSTPILPATLASGKKLSKKQPSLARPCSVFGWMIHGAGVFLRAYRAEAGAMATITPEPSNAWTSGREAALRDIARVTSPAPRWSSPTKCLTSWPATIGWSCPDSTAGSPPGSSSLGGDFAGLIERHRNLDIAGIGRRVQNDSRCEII
jgi:hypothetical protein